MLLAVPPEKQPAPALCAFVFRFITLTMPKYSTVASTAVVGVAFFLRQQQPIVSCTPDQPFLTRSAIKLSVDDLDQLRNLTTTRASELQESNDNQLNDDAFSMTSGFVLHFNREGLKFIQDPASDYHYLLPFFDAVQDATANAFTLNALIVPPTPPGQAFAVKPHIDNTVSIVHEQQFHAHEVAVLYLQVPAAMQGGELLLWRRGGETSRPDERVQPSDSPSDNLVTFRGDAVHGINAMRLASGDGSDDTCDDNSPQVRISLVLEQYRIPDAFYAFTTTFHLRASGSLPRDVGLALFRMRQRFNSRRLYVVLAAATWLICSIWVTQRYRSLLPPVTTDVAAQATPQAPLKPTKAARKAAAIAREKEKQGQGAATVQPQEEEQNQQQPLLKQLLACALGFAALIGLLLYV